MDYRWRWLDLLIFINQNPSSFESKCVSSSFRDSNLVFDQETRLRFNSVKPLVINEGGKVNKAEEEIVLKSMNVEVDLTAGNCIKGKYNVEAEMEEVVPERVRQTSGSSSRARIHHRFREIEYEAAYHRYKECGITISIVINPVHLSYLVMDLFAHTSLYFILSLAISFHSELLHEFFANLRINPTFIASTSYVNRCPIEITYQDCVKLLQLSTIGDKLHIIISDPDFDWSMENHFLRQTNAPFHVGETSSLVKDARTIQHVLRTSIIPKAGDRIHITPLLSLTTFYIMAHREFNTADIIFCTRLHPRDEEPRGAKEEEAPAPAPVTDPTPLQQHLQLDQLVERFDHWETHFDAYVVAQEQQYSEDIASYEQHRTEDLAHFDSYITHH
ncbi:hypothetical protein MA16_Dca014544 [Dendrobium catenatum]|uniref:Uncharacterized protein n=1 Tax=Dendrobium catenatum TaxID=906689 RepID=A0A2I0WA16_9ASPA|nr:hypothetical protein MA16_Dca014544 [Dendrobium catenatum]